MYCRSDHIGLQLCDNFHILYRRLYTSRDSEIIFRIIIRMKVAILVRGRTHKIYRMPAVRAADFRKGTVRIEFTERYNSKVQVRVRTNRTSKVQVRVRTNRI